MLLDTVHPAHPILRVHLLAPDPPYSPNPTGSLDPASPPTAVRSTAESVGSCSVLSFEVCCRRCCRRRGVGGAVDVVDDAGRRKRVDTRVLLPPQSCSRPWRSSCSSASTSRPPEGQKVGDMMTVLFLFLRRESPICSCGVRGYLTP